jgi:phage gpG-like protein
MSFKVTQDLISPATRKLVKSFSDTKPIMEAMGQEVVSITKRAFNDPSLRVSAWAPVKKSGREAGTGRFASTAALKASGAMWQSIRITGLTGREVRAGTDRPYATYHQFGTKAYTIRPVAAKALSWPGAAHPVKVVHHPGLSPRPFFPFDANGVMAPFARDKVRAVADAKIRSMCRAAGATPR